jgi:hypothetical protein
MSTQPSSVTSSLNQLKLGKLPMLRLSSTIKTSILTNQIIEFVVNEIKLIPNYQTMSTDLHLMHHIANVVENLERKDLEPKLDKKQLFIDIVKILFPDLKTEQLSFLDNFADFICASNLVNKVSTMTKVFTSVKKNLVPSM